jgi:pimeloyl-ACP methyl ester carboxylesterase
MNERPETWAAHAAASGGRGPSGACLATRRHLAWHASTAMVGVEHTIVVPEGRALRVLEAGNPAGVPVVVHHGTPSCRFLYERWREDATRRGIRLIGYDRPGYGGSDRLPGRTIADAAADVEAICDALGLERILTHGSSGGGPHALACAALLGERVAAAATLAAVGPWDADGLDWLAGMGEGSVVEFRAASQGSDAVAPLLERMAEGMLNAGPDDLATELESVLSPPDLAAVSGGLAGVMLEKTREAIGATRVGWLDDDLAFMSPWGFDLASIAIPVQLWQGRQDLMVPPAHGEWLAKRIPDVDTRFLADEGHLSIEQHHIGDVHAWLLERF